ncbi:TPA: hypothetical protein ACGHHD_001225 [Salmonella enterica subsp. enterica serovar Cotham]
MTTITKERLLTIKQWRETYGPGSNVVLPAEEAEELARIALASLEAEPVAKIIAHYPLGIDVGKQKFVQAIGELPDFGGYLFAAPPAPIALEAIENAIEYIRSIAFHIDEDDYHGKHIAYFMRQALVWLEGHSCSDDRQGKAENQPVRGNQAAESNRGNEWTGNPDIDNAIIMLDRIDTLENCDDDRIEGVKAVLRRLAGNSPVIPEDLRRAAMLQGAEPVSQTYNLPELIEGMEVSIDVSTCDADAGNRYFGTVTEVSELDTAKNGYILLVQDAEPNFDVNGNSPVIPEGLVKAVHFYEQAKRENPPIETGVWKDAIDWVLKEACLAASTLESSREHEVISQQEKA